MASAGDLAPPAAVSATQPSEPVPPTGSLDDEVVRICSELIRIDTSNFGDNEGPGELAAAEYVVAELREMGYEPELFESAPGRANVVLRIPGVDPSRPGLVLHGHLDVVPAHAPDWQVGPFSGAIRDGCVWGRGAVDMKGMVSMMVCVARDLARTGRRPARDIVFAFFADEEAGGIYGAQWLVRHRPELFDGCTEAVSEVGGFSVTLGGSGRDDGRRAYFLQSAEKGVLWLRLTARGRAGHGSVRNSENATVRLSEAISRIDAYAWPQQLIASVRSLFERLSEMIGTPFDETDLEPQLAALGGARPFVEATLSNTSTPTTLQAGYKNNVVPQTATATVDCRFLPGQGEELLAVIKDLCGPHVEATVVHGDVALESEFDVPLVLRMTDALLAEDPHADVVPYCLSGGTDNKHLSMLGIKGYGFVPLRLPADLDFVSMFHGIDERVPIDALQFGVRVLLRLLDTC